MSNRTKETKMEKLGKAGEAIMANYFIKNGDALELPPNQYDSKKDFIVNGKLVEVKTQVPFVTKNAFSVKRNQLHKCSSVEYTYFIGVTNSVKDIEACHNVYRIKGEHFLTNMFVHTCKDGREMCLIPVDQPYMEKVFALQEDHKKLLNGYSVSDWAKEQNIHTILYG